MINLIPPVAKKIMARDYLTRVGTAWVFLIGTACIIIALLLLPTYVLIQVKTSLVSEQAKDATEKMASYNVSATELQTANRQAQILLQDPEQTTFSDFIVYLESVAGSDVVVNEFHFIRTKNAGSAILSGVAKTRQSLADFRDVLEVDNRFVKVDLPISNLIKDRDLPFSMTLTMSTTTATTTPTS